jgi:hypothetical protein
MREQITKGLKYVSLLIAGVASFFIPLFLLNLEVESKLIWSVFAPGWVISPFGHADLPEMLVAFVINLICYSVVTYGIVYSAMWMLHRMRYR